MAPCQARTTGEAVRKPAGERIVAFARPGKPPGKRFLGPGGALSVRRKHP